MAEYSKLASGSVISTGGQTAVVLPFMPQYIEFVNTTEIVAADNEVQRAWWYQDMGQGTAVYEQSDSQLLYTATGGFTTIQAGLALQYGPTFFLGGSGGITKDSAAPVVTTTADHGLTTGDWVIFQNLYETTTTGMQQIAGIPFMVTVTGATTFTISWNTNQSNYTAIAAGGLNANASFKQILYPVLYAPGVSFVEAITLGTTTIIDTTVPHNFVVGQEIAFRIPSAWGTSQLNSLPNTLIPGSPIYGFVTAVNSSTEFVCNINSSAFTAFNSNQPFLSFHGEQWPQVVAVGDVNTGGWQYNGGNLYPSPRFFNGFTASTSVGVSTINGPAIAGAFSNATFQGFIIGSTISGTVGDQIYWKAEYMDYAV